MDVATDQKRKPTAEELAALSPKARRAWEFLDEHMKRMATKRGGLREFRCLGCQAAIAHYVPPTALFLWPCHLCGHINKLSSSLNGNGS